jgi:hypothetical protein
MLYACKGAHTLFTGQIEREREREYLFLKRMTDALAPFSYLVNICSVYALNVLCVLVHFIKEVPNAQSGPTTD